MWWYATTTSPYWAPVYGVATSPLTNCATSVHISKFKFT